MSRVQVPSPAYLDRRCPQRTAAFSLDSGPPSNSAVEPLVETQKTVKFVSAVTAFAARGRAYVEGLVEGKCNPPAEPSPEAAHMESRSATIIWPGRQQCGNGPSHVE